ncbi:MAG: 16S rRNA (cytidine(1402)-2'-O)-methyltransferase [Bifidobacteriaceae bacterium]|jgi:16S rRNA (cytidine1402-2'-O)-methyltransferase|nr:16S rRNA (cytidine(1402)-2'-O)-methyltransferase [Bifidobacteriaceae bacterium]
MEALSGLAPRGIVLAATPLGNPLDASRHLCELLAAADVVAAEDTRRVRALADRLGVAIGGRLVSFYDHNERSRVPELLEAAREGTVLVVSDAGMPLVSDPGFVLVRLALEASLPVSVAPGPSAVTAALAVSGLPCDRFTFEGFVPRRVGERTGLLESLAGEGRTMVFFESPRRLGQTLSQMAEVFGADRPAVVCRELTKTHQEVRRGTLAELAQWAGDGVLGEVTLVVGGAPGGRPAPPPLEALAVMVLSRADAGERLKDAAAEVAAAHGVSRRELYQAALDQREAGQ